MLTNTNLVVLALLNLLTPLDSQSVVSVLPLYVTDVMHQPPHYVGRLAIGLVTASMASFALLPHMLRRWGARKVLLGSMAVRGASGLVYVWAISRRNGAALLAARVMYGATMHTFAIPSILIGHCALTERQYTNALALVNAAFFVGTAMGPAWGTVLFMLRPDYTIHGVYTLGTSATLAALVGWSRGALPKGDAVPITASPQYGPPPAVEGPIAWSNLCTTTGLMMGFELLLPLALRDSYGLRAEGTLPAWASLSACMIASYALAPHLVTRYSWPGLARALVALMLSLALVPLNVRDPSVAVPFGIALVGFVYAFPVTILHVLNTTALLRRTPRHLHEATQARFFFAGQLGRLVGACTALPSYEWFVARHGRASGYNAAMRYLLAWLAIANAPLAVGARSVYARGVALV